MTSLSLLITQFIGNILVVGVGTLFAWLNWHSQQQKLKVDSTMSKQDVKEFVEDKLSPLKEKDRSLADKVDEINGRLDNVESKLDKLIDKLL